MVDPEKWGVSVSDLCQERLEIFQLSNEIQGRHHSSSHPQECRNNIIQL